MLDDNSGLYQQQQEEQQQYEESREEFWSNYAELFKKEFNPGDEK